MIHQELSEMLPAYALDALTPEEMRAVDAHLATCSECQRDLAALRDVTTGLSLAAEGVTPPAMLRQRVLAEARGTRAPSVWSRWLVGVTAAAAALLVILAGISVSLDRQLSALSRRLAAQEQVLALLAAPTAKTTSLRGSVEASVRFVYDPARRQGALVVSDLKDPGRDFVYQLWLVAGQKPESAGIFRPIPGQPIVVSVSADFARYQAVAISVERGPLGALKPTTTPILVGTIKG